MVRKRHKEADEERQETGRRKSEKRAGKAERDTGSEAERV